MSIGLLMGINVESYPISESKKHSGYFASASSFSSSCLRVAFFLD